MKKFLFDFFPIILFFIAFKMSADPKTGIINATAVAIGASLIQVAYAKWRHGKVERMHLVTMIVIVLMGGLTIALDNEMFIKWKPTIVHWILALVFLGSQYIGAKPIVQRMIGQTIDLPRTIWTRLNFGWVAFFSIVGVINLYVVYNFDTEAWVNFKLFGTLGLTAVFAILQTVYLMRHIKEEDEAEPETDCQDAPIE